MSGSVVVVTSNTPILSSGRVRPRRRTENASAALGHPLVVDREPVPEPIAHRTGA